MALNHGVVALSVSVLNIWQMHHMISTKRKKEMLLSRDAATKHGGSLLAGASMLDALVLARLADAFAKAALLVWARPHIRPAIVIANSDTLLAPLLQGAFRDRNQLYFRFAIPST